MIAIAGAIACSARPPPPQPAEPKPGPATSSAAASDAPTLDQDLPRLVARSLAMYQDVAQALAASGNDCAAAIDKLRPLAGTYREVVRANAKVLHDGRARQLKAALEPHDEEFGRLAQAIVQSPTVAACSTDPAFSRAYDELFAAPS